MKRVFFFTMKIMKNNLRNRIEDKWMKNCLITYIEKNIFNYIDKETDNSTILTNTKISWTFIDKIHVIQIYLMYIFLS